MVKFDTSSMSSAHSPKTLQGSWLHWQQAQFCTMIFLRQEPVRSGQIRSPFNLDICLNWWVKLVNKATWWVVMYPLDGRSDQHPVATMIMDVQSSGAWDRDWSNRQGVRSDTYRLIIESNWPRSSFHGSDEKLKEEIFEGTFHFHNLFCSLSIVTEQKVHWQVQDSLPTWSGSAQHQWLFAFLPL